MTDATEVDRYVQACTLVVTHKRASISWLQRQMQIGYNGAKALIDRMEAEGIVSATGAMGVRSILKDEVELGQKIARDDLHQLAAGLVAMGTTVSTDEDGNAQLIIPVDLPRANRAADDRLRLLIERIERLQEEAKDIASDIKDVFGEVKSVGYDVKTVRAVLKLRRMDPDSRREMEALIETYKCALGID